MQRRTGLAAGLLAGFAADALLGDPRYGHPVAAFGRASAALERSLWRDSRGAGAVYAGVCVGAAVAGGALIERGLRPRRSYPLAVAAVTWAVLGGESLRREAAAVQRHLDADDLPAARVQLTHLVGRDTSSLDAGQVARAVVESVAENTSDAVVAPLVWGALAGMPGLLGYRAVNTLDAMVGYRSTRYARFGTASARLDDVANLIPARLTAGLVALLSRCRAEVVRIVRRDARKHPSPNAGWCESAFAASLQLRLGGRNVYGDRVEDRPVLGDGRTPAPADIGAASALARQVGVAAAVLAAAAAAAGAGKRS